ncbi:unnamed protein product [Gongylonema pulchrum]|uniref:Uncharacterized protein n=1 Tax=Gongylonema pulchrum TaxID=637853 RepID=A0A183DAV4_9BILA|nr:unnamed protein product [Gongylonema pulchrum]
MAPDSLLSVSCSELYYQFPQQQYNEGGRLITNGSLSNGRYSSSLSDSLRRGELRYNPNGDIREVHHSSSARNGRIHKSYSTR